MDHLLGKKVVKLFGANLLEDINEEREIKEKGKGKMVEAEVCDHGCNYSKPSSSRSTKSIVVNIDEKMTKRKRKLENCNLDGRLGETKVVALFGVNLLETREKGKRKMIETQVYDHGNNPNPTSSRGTKSIVVSEKKIEKKKKTRKIKLENRNLDYDHQEPAPPLFHRTILEEIHEPPVFLFEKKLSRSDVKKGLNRLLITRKDKLLEFLKEEERRKVLGDTKDFLPVIAQEALLGDKQHTLHLTKWTMGKEMIVLKNDWSKLVVDYGLKRGNSVQGWGYRRGHEFRFALNIIRN